MKRIKLKTKEHGTMLSTNEMKCIVGGEKNEIYKCKCSPLSTVIDFAQAIDPSGAAYKVWASGKCSGFVLSEIRCTKYCNLSGVLY